MPAEQQVGRQHDDHLGHAVRQELACDEQARADQDLRERVAVALFLLVLGRDDAGLALNGFTDLTDLGEQGVRVFAGHAQLFGLIDQHALVHAVELADLVLHFGRAVRAAEVLDGVYALIALAVVPGRGRDDFGLAFDGPADLADPGEQGVRVFAGHTQLPGLIDQHAVVHAVELADLVLHFGGAVRAAEVLHRVDALDAVRARRVVVLMPVVVMVMAAAAGTVVMMVVFVLMVVMAAAALAVVMMMLVLMVVMTAGAFAVVMVLVLMVVMAAGAFAVVMVLVLMVVVVAGTFTIVVMMIVIFDDFIMIVANVFFYIRVLCIMVVMMP